MLLKIINMGRNNVNREVILKNPSYSAILREVKKDLLSKRPDIEETDDPHMFDVFASMRIVGQIWVEQPHFMTLL